MEEKKRLEEIHNGDKRLNLLTIPVEFKSERVHNLGKKRS
jgi:hypothetical protein